MGVAYWIVVFGQQTYFSKWVAAVAIKEAEHHSSVDAIISCRNTASLPVNGPLLYMSGNVTYIISPTMSRGEMPPMLNGQHDAICA